MQITAYVRDLNIGLALSVRGDLKWCGTYSNRQRC